MRAEGVFRLILNVALFQGMSCERQDKWVRLIAFENGAVLHVALRVSSLLFAPSPPVHPLTSSLQCCRLYSSEPPREQRISYVPHTSLPYLSLHQDTDLVCFLPLFSSTPSSG